MDKEFTFPAKDGAAIDGSEYYEVESEDTKIKGCYTKMQFHNVNHFNTLNYPIYRQTGDAKNGYFLKTNNEQLVPWLFTDKTGIVIYR